MGNPKPIQSAAALSGQVKPDLVGLLLAHYRDRIELCSPFEVSDLAEEFSKRYSCHVTERMITIAMATALTYLEEE